ALVCGVFLQPAVCQWFGIYSDMWMQDRYYRNYGVVTGFLTNLNVLNIAEPDGYSQQAIEDVEKQVAQKADNQKPLYADSYAVTAGKPEKTPNII
ncbi:MAG: LTA synthase family protein, partial [Ruthenibacterium sp.]